MDKKKYKALLFAGAIAGLNNRAVLAETPATEEFFHISPALIISSATKRGGVVKYLNCKSAGNCKSRPATCKMKFRTYKPVKLYSVLQ